MKTSNVMIDFISKEEDFVAIKSRFLQLFTDKAEFPGYLFKVTLECFLAFEFDFIYHESFLDGLQIFLKKEALQKFVFFTISPSPEGFYYRNFSKYSIIEVPISASNSDFNEIMMRTPVDGGDNIDSLAICSNDIAIFSSSDEWAIVGSREWEVAIVGFRSVELKAKFIESFGESADMLNSVQRQVEILDEMLNFNEHVMSDYMRLAENYRDKPQLTR